MNAIKYIFPWLSEEELSAMGWDELVAIRIRHQGNCGIGDDPHDFGVL